MANTRNIVDAILQEDLFTAKKLINESLLQKLGNALEEKLVDFAPTVFNEGSKPDFLDLDKDGNKKEPMKKAAKEANEDIEIDEDMENIVESFEAELSQLIEEIENETGETLTEEEIAEIANEFLDTLSEENESMEELTEDESMEETEEEEKDDGVEEDEGQDVPYQRTIGGVDY